MTSIQPELWVETPGEAVAFYEAAFGATVLHCVGEGDDIVAQIGVGGAAFWVAGTSAAMRRAQPSRDRWHHQPERCPWSKTPSGSSGRQLPPARPNRGAGATQYGAFVEQSGCKRAQVTATWAAAKAAQLLATRRLQLPPLASDPRW